MFFEILALVLVASLIIAVSIPLVRKALKRNAEKKYAAVYTEAAKTARYLGSYGYVFRVGNYDDVLTVSDMLALRKIYLDAVFNEGFRIGKIGFNNQLACLNIHFNDSAAEQAYNAGYEKGFAERSMLV